MSEMRLIPLKNGADLYHTNAQARRYVQESLSANTRKAIKSDLAHFKNWGGCIPCGADVIVRFLTDHAERLKVATLKRKLASITKLHRMGGYKSPCGDEIVRLTMRGIARVHGAPQRQAKPLLKEDIISIITQMGDSRKEQRDKALLLIGFAGALRRSELVDIKACDVEYLPQGVKITISTSKTDKSNAGRVIGIPYGRGHVCPVKALKAWMEILGGEGYIFTAIRSEASNRPLSTRSISNIVKCYAQSIGLEAKYYSGHSLRAGLATSAAMHGVASYKIRQQTGHKSDAMLSRYIREGDLFTDNAAGHLF